MKEEKQTTWRCSEVFNQGGIALKGYDVVAYFSEGMARKGLLDYEVEYQGLVWRFSSEANKVAFMKDSSNYLPQFGGYCAFGASQGYKASTKPHVFEIVDGKLYFNFARYVQKRWRRDMEKNILAAEAKWPATKSTALIQAHPIPIWWKYQFLKLVGKDLFK